MRGHQGVAPGGGAGDPDGDPGSFDAATGGGRSQLGGDRGRVLVAEQQHHVAAMGSGQHHPVRERAEPAEHGRRVDVAAAHRDQYPDGSTVPSGQARSASAAGPAGLRGRRRAGRPSHAATARPPGGGTAAPAVTTAARSTIRRSAPVSSPAPPIASAPRRSPRGGGDGPAVLGADQPAAARRTVEDGVQVDRRYGGQLVARGIDQDDPAAEQLGQRGGDRVHVTPDSTISANRSCAAAACSTPAWAADTSSSAAAVSAAARTCTIVTAASAASEPSSDTSSRLNGRLVQFEANSTPTNEPSTISGVPQIATSPSSPTAESIIVVCRNRSSDG